MGTDAAKELAKAIAIHHRLTEVDLAKNAIGDGAADALALALRAPKMRYVPARREASTVWSLSPSLAPADVAGHDAASLTIPGPC
jgi:hypothetical protein